MKTLFSVAALAMLSGCAGLGSPIYTVAPKFTGQPVEPMAMYFGAPERVTEVGSIKFYEWRIGQYETEPDRIDGRVSNGGSVTGTIDRGNTHFRGCIVQASVDEAGAVTGVTLDSRPQNATRANKYVYDPGCGRLVDDPFQTVSAKK